MSRRQKTFKTLTENCRGKSEGPINEKNLQTLAELVEENQKALLKLLVPGGALRKSSSRTLDRKNLPGYRKTLGGKTEKGRIKKEEKVVDGLKFFESQNRNKNRKFSPFSRAC